VDNVLPFTHLTDAEQMDLVQVAEPHSGQIMIECDFHYVSSNRVKHPILPTIKWAMTGILVCCKRSSVIILHRNINLVGILDNT